MQNQALHAFRFCSDVSGGACEAHAAQRNVRVDAARPPACGFAWLFQKLTQGSCGRTSVADRASPVRTICFALDTAEAVPRDAAAAREAMTLLLARYFRGFL